jgi:primosomal protein N' (replication factor Y)
LPPFSFEAIWRAEGKSLDKINKLLNYIKDISEPYLNQDLFCLGPIPALLVKKAGLHQYQLLIRSSSRKLLHGLIAHQKKNLSLNKLSGVRVFLEIDPVMA